MQTLLECCSCQNLWKASVRSVIASAKQQQIRQQLPPSDCLVGWQSAKGVGRLASRWWSTALRHHLPRGLLRLGCLPWVDVLRAQITSVTLLAHKLAWVQHRSAWAYLHILRSRADDMLWRIRGQGSVISEARAPWQRFVARHTVHLKPA